MSAWLAVVMGVVQGLTEFLPISSTAHLRITPTLLGQPDAGAAYTAVIQLGTLAAMLLYFARDLFVTIPRAAVGYLHRRVTAGGGPPSTPAEQLPFKLVLGTVPIVVAGLLLKHQIEGPLRSLWVVTGSLLGVGALMIWIDARARGERGVLDVGWLDAFLIGCAQACALVPGVSRSGSTICVALLLGMSRREAARFSFLLGVPAIGGAGLLELKKAVGELHADAIAPLAIGTVVSAVVGYLSIAWLLRFLGSHRLLPFGLYRLALGVALAALLAGNVIAATAGA